MKKEKPTNRERILANFEIKQIQTGKEAGLWYCFVDGRKYQANDRTVLEDKLIVISKQQSTTFRSVFYESEKYTLSRIKDSEKLASAVNTYEAHRKSFDRFIHDSFIENAIVQKISKDDLLVFLDDVLAKGVKKKAFANLKIILNKTFTYSVKKGYIISNPVESIFWEEYENCFETPAPIKMRGFTNTELHKLYLFAREMEEKHPEQIKWWSYEFVLLTALRRGEVPPFEWTDIKKDHIDICKEIVGIRKPYTIKNTTKTGRDRKFPMSDVLLDFLNRLHANNEVYYPGNKFLFPDPNEELGCITHNLTYRAHKRACKKLDIPIDSFYRKGTHAIRRSHETSFLESGGSLDLAAKIYGNSPKVIASNYLLSVNANSSLKYIESIHNNLFVADKSSVSDDLLFNN